MDRDNILEPENGFNKRELIYDYILKYPGLHNREISRKLNIPRSTLLYHLNYLKKRGLIIEKDYGGYLRFFNSEEIMDFDKEYFSIIRKRVIRSILFVLAYYRVCTQTEIVKHLKNDYNIKKHPTTISFHLEKLLNLGLIDCNPKGREKLYLPNYKTAHLLIDFMLTHKMSFLSDNLIWHLNRLNKPSSKRFERAEKVFYNVFPHPYHV